MALSSSLTTDLKHDVYLSFRGEDVRNNFISHLHGALLRKKIKTFSDSDLSRGEEIAPSLLRAIEESKISVVVFSENYASSVWLLEELTKILKCQRLFGQVVIPVFYHVDRSDVRNQTGRFGLGFSRVEERFEENPERLTRWRTALIEVANLSGFWTGASRPESQLIEEIVEDIWRRLQYTLVLGHEQVEEVLKHGWVSELESHGWDSEFESKGSRFLDLSITEFQYESQDLRSKYESQGWRFLSVFFLVMEAISVVLDVYGKSKKNFLLAAFVLSAFGFIITIYAFIRKRRTAAYRQKPVRELAWVEVAFSVLPLVTLFIQYILAVAGVKNSYSPSLYPLVFALVVVVFAFKKKQISRSQRAPAP